MIFGVVAGVLLLGNFTKDGDLTSGPKRRRAVLHSLLPTRT